MEKYRRVVDQNSASQVLPEADRIVRVNVSGKLANYISYAEKKLCDVDGGGKVELVALGRAINRAVTVAEILRRNHSAAQGIHQLVKLRSVELKDRYEPLEEGLRTLELERTMSSISITLANSTDDIDTSAPGYAPPLTDEEAIPIPSEKILEMDQERSGGGRGNGNGEKSANGAERENGNGNGKGRGRRHRNRRRGPRKVKGKGSVPASEEEAPVTATTNDADAPVSNVAAPVVAATKAATPE